MSLIKTKSIQLGWDLTPTNNFTIYQPATPDGTFRIAVGNSGSTTDIMTVSSTGSVTYAGSTSYAGLGFGSGSATAPSIFPNGDTNTGMYFPNAETIGFSTNGTERLTINSSGTVATAGDLSVGGFLVLGTNWKAKEESGVLYFYYGATKKAKLDSSGNLTVAGDVTAFGTV